MRGKVVLPVYEPVDILPFEFATDNALFAVDCADCICVYVPSCVRLYPKYKLLLYSIILPLSKHYIIYIVSHATISGNNFHT